MEGLRVRIAQIIRRSQRTAFSALPRLVPFETLNFKPELVKAAYAAFYDAPTTMQVKILKELLADPPRNVIAQAQSGTGKTVAFVMAMLSRIHSSPECPQAVCLAPTPELAMQIKEAAQQLAKFCPDIQIKLAVRGEELARGSKIVEHMVIGTPGKLLDWALKFKFFDPKKVEVFVLDEADVLIATQGAESQCLRIYKQLPTTCQTLFFSAT